MGREIVSVSESLIGKKIRRQWKYTFVAQERFVYVCSQQHLSNLVLHYRKISILWNGRLTVYSCTY